MVKKHKWSPDNAPSADAPQADQSGECDTCHHGKDRHIGRGTECSVAGCQCQSYRDGPVGKAEPSHVDEPAAVDAPEGMSDEKENLP
jgi:hypothetical protein